MQAFSVSCYLSTLLLPLTLLLSLRMPLADLTLTSPVAESLAWSLIVKLTRWVDASVLMRDLTMLIIRHGQAVISRVVTCLAIIQTLMYSGLDLLPLHDLVIFPTILIIV